MPHRRRRDADGGPPSSPGRPPAQASRVRAARERERALPRSDFWVLSFGKSGSLKGNYTREATDNGVGGDRAVFRRGVGEGSELELHCPSLVLQERMESEPRDHATGRQGGQGRGREGSGRITRFNVGGGGGPFFAECLSEKPLPPLIPFLFTRGAVILVLRNQSLIRFNVPSFCPLATFSQKLPNHFRRVFV